MAVPLKFSEAFAIGLHAITIIASRQDETISVTDITEQLHCSLAHLQKVLQRLVKSGLLKSVRGPGGGFVMAWNPEDIYVLDVYEAIEGKLELRNCLFEDKVCSRHLCVLGGLITKINNDISSYFSKTPLTDIL